MRSAPYLGVFVFALAVPACAVVLGFEEPVDRGSAPAGASGSSASTPTGGASTAGPSSTSAPESTALPDGAPADAGAEAEAARELAGRGSSPSCSCEPEAPPGWSGPVALVASAGEPAPCDGAYPLELGLAHASPSAAPATCACACGPPGGAGCTDGSLSFFSDSSCEDPCGGPIVAGSGTCTAARPALGRCGWREVRAVRYAPGAANGGSCAPIASKSVAPIVWGESVRVCAPASAPPKAACGAGESCAPPRSAPQSIQRCIARVGAHDCPKPFLTRTVLHESATDTRTCTACSCGSPAGVGCSATVTAYKGLVCGGSAVRSVGPKCTSTSGADLVEVEDAIASGGLCQPSGGAPTGEVSVASPLTICCE